MTVVPANSASRIGGIDPLDTLPTDAPPAGALVTPGGEGIGRQTSVPVALALVMGIVLGPLGIGVVSANTLRFLEPAVPAALAVVGVLVGLSLDRGLRHRMVIASAVSEGLVTIALIAGTAAGLAAATGASSLVSPWWLGLVTGIAAMMLSPQMPTAAASAARIIGDMQARVVIGIAAGGIVLAAARSSDGLSALVLLVEACLVTLVLACAAWLLLTGSSQQSEQRLFAIAALLLVGGAADFLSLSALFGGLLAGAFWQTVGGDARESMLRDALYIQRPLAILMLVVAGARVEPTLAAIGLGLLVGLLRLLASPVGRILSKRAPAPETARSFPDGLPFDVFGVAFALNALRAVGPEMTLVLSVVVLATIGTELWTWLQRRGGVPG